MQLPTCKYNSQIQKQDPEIRKRWQQCLDCAANLLRKEHYELVPPSAYRIQITPMAYIEREGMISTLANELMNKEA